MTILDNAVDSIVLGVEDYETGADEPRRLLSAARNLVAGILLLFKAKLVSLSPADSNEVLIKTRVLPVRMPDGTVTWRGDGRTTVNYQAIQERCNSLGIRVDWQRADAIVRRRNEIEHYYTHLSRDALRSLLAESFVLIRDFMRLELDADPLALLGPDAWESLTEVHEVYERERRECETNLAGIEWRFSDLRNAILEWMCPECGSGLLDVYHIDGEDEPRFRCRSCGHGASYKDAAEQALREFYRFQDYASVKDGGEPTTVYCPACTRETYHLQEDVCLLCGETAERTCQRCGAPIPSSEIDGSGYCAWCAWRD